MASAVLPHSTMLCHWVFSLASPSLLVNFSVVAMLKLATAEPPAVKRITASLPRLPTRIALLTLPMFVRSSHPSRVALEKIDSGVESLLDDAQPLQRLCRQEIA